MESEDEYESRCRDALAAGKFEEFSKNVASWMLRFGKNSRNLPFIAITRYINGDYDGCIEELLKPGVKEEYKIYAVFSYILLGKYTEAKALLDSMAKAFAGNKKITNRLHVFKEIINLLAGEGTELSWEKDRDEIVDFINMVAEKEEDPIIKNSMLLILDGLRKRE